MSKYERKAQSQRKHGPLSISGASKAPVAPPRNRPEWKGPGYIKKQPSRAPPPSSASIITVQEQLLKPELQQLVLDIYRDTFPASKDFDDLKPMLQEIRDALSRLDFEGAFGKEEYLEGYALRWSPSRTLLYSNLLASICRDRTDDEWVQSFVGNCHQDGSEQAVNPPSKVVCFGGGAAELMAFAGLLRHFCPGAGGRPVSQSSNQSPEVVESSMSLSMSDPASTVSASSIIDLNLVDLANWSCVVSKLRNGLETPPILSKYASAAARSSNASFLSPKFLQTTSTRTNVLRASTDDILSMIGSDPALLTFLFTLNELYTTSIPKTTAFLLRLTTVAPRGSLLLVVDNPGCYSEAAISGSKEDEEAENDRKKYPMHWLMDHILLEKHVKKEKDAEAKAKWEKVVSEENRLYRLEEKLRYPASLENTRFQVHLFKRL